MLDFSDESISPKKCIVYVYFSYTRIGKSAKIYMRDRISLDYKERLWIFIIIQKGN
jgi:hypothetical protein